MRTRVVLMLMSLAVTACGKKGALIYPEMLVPAAPSAVVAQQSGNSLKLSFVLPSKDRAGQNRAAPSGVTILRRDEAAGQNPGCSACTEDFSSFRNFTLDLLPDGIQRNGNRVVLIDGDVSSGRKYSYRVNTVTKDDLAGAPSLSNTAVMLPPPLPPLLQAISQPTEVRLEFFGQLPLEGTIAGYQVALHVTASRRRNSVRRPLLKTTPPTENFQAYRS